MIYIAEKWNRVISASLSVTKKTPGISIARDKAKIVRYSLEFNRSKSWKDSLPISAPILPKKMNYSQTDPGSFTTAAGLTHNKRDIFKHLNVKPNIQKRDVCGFHGDGQYREFKVGQLMKKDYELSDWFCFQDCISHLIESVVGDVIEDNGWFQCALISNQLLTSFFIYSTKRTKDVIEYLDEAWFVQFRSYSTVCSTSTPTTFTSPNSRKST